MREYIVEFDVALYDEKTGQAVFQPKIEGELIRCKDCKRRYIKNDVWTCPFGLMSGPDDYCGYAERKES